MREKMLGVAVLRACCAQAWAVPTLSTVTTKPGHSARRSMSR